MLEAAAIRPRLVERLEELSRKLTILDRDRPYQLTDEARLPDPTSAPGRTNACAPPRRAPTRTTPTVQEDRVVAARGRRAGARRWRRDR